MDRPHKNAFEYSKFCPVPKFIYALDLKMANALNSLFHNLFKTIYSQSVYTLTVYIIEVFAKSERREYKMLQQQRKNVYLTDNRKRRDINWYANSLAMFCMLNEILLVFRWKKKKKNH